MSTLPRSLGLIASVLVIAGCSTAPAPAPVAAQIEPELLPKPDPRVARYGNGVVWIGPSFAPQPTSVVEANPAVPKPTAKSVEPVVAKEPKPVVVPVIDLKSTGPKPAVSVPAQAAEKAHAPEPAKAVADSHAALDPHAAAPNAHAASTSRTPAEALALLQAGNERFVAGHLEHPDQTIERRSEVAKGQHPYAIVLSCADSRVPPELIFDAGLGDLFVVRVAGNTANDAAIGSIEYAVEHLGANLIVVLGHERCGAVKAAVDTADAKTPAPGHLPAVLAPIAPAVEQVKHEQGDTVDLAVRANVARVVEQLKASDPVLANLVKAGKLQVIGGRYDLDSGYAEIK